MHDTVDVIFSAAFAKSFDYALNAIATQTVAQLVRRMHGGTYCLKQAMNKYDDCIHTDLMHRFATTPISEQLQSDNEDRAVLLTIQLIKKVADQIRTSPPAGAPKIQPYFVDEEDPGVKDGGKFSVQVNSKNYDRSRPQDKPSRPAGKPSSALIVRKPAPVRKASRAQTARKPRKILTLEDVGQAPLERFVTP